VCVLRKGEKKVNAGGQLGRIPYQPSTIVHIIDLNAFR